jgi:FkbM family methyltransferase
MPLERLMTHLWRGVRRAPAVQGAGLAAMRMAAGGLARAQRISFPPEAEMEPNTRLRYALGWYERESLNVVDRLVQPGMVALDVGAHIGYYTWRLARRVGPTGRVVALEPHGPTFQLLERNVPASRFPNVELLPVAAGETPGETEFVEFTSSRKHSIYDVSAFAAELQVKSRHMVRVTRIDDLLAERGIDTLQFVKLDIEGAEQIALRGMSKTLSASPAAAVIVEYNALTIRAAGGTPDEFLSELRGYGLDLLLLTEPGAILDMPDSAAELLEDGYVNMLGIKGMPAREALARPEAFRDRALSIPRSR